MKTLRKLWWKLIRPWQPRKEFYRYELGVFRRARIEDAQPYDRGIILEIRDDVLVWLWAVEVTENQGYADNGHPMLSVNTVDMRNICWTGFDDKVSVACDDPDEAPLERERGA